MVPPADCEGPSTRASRIRQSWVNEAVDAYNIRAGFELGEESPKGHVSVSRDERGRTTWRAGATVRSIRLLSELLQPAKERAKKKAGGDLRARQISATAASVREEIKTWHADYRRQWPNQPKKTLELDLADHLAHLVQCGTLPSAPLSSSALRAHLSALGLQ